MNLEEQLESLIPAALCNGDGAQTLAEIARSSYRAELMASWTQDAGVESLGSHVVHDTIVGDPILEEKVRVSLPLVLDTISGPTVCYDLSMNVLTAVAQRGIVEIVQIPAPDRNVVETRVNAALAALAGASSAWYNFVSTTTARIAALSAPRLESGSASWPVPGVTILFNVEQPESQLADLVSGLIHEAVHHTLHMIEAACPAYSWAELQPRSMSMVSPWTGNKLPLRSYMHALFVWHTLFYAWTDVDWGSAGIDTGVVRAELDEARSGLEAIARDGIDDIETIIPAGYARSAQRLRTHWQSINPGEETG